MFYLNNRIIHIKHVTVAEVITKVHRITYTVFIKRF